MIDKICEECSEEFKTNYKGKRFCDRVCGDVNYRRRLLTENNLRSPGETKGAAIKRKTISKKFGITEAEYIDLNKGCSICIFDTSIHIHHVFPRNKGGLDSIDNYIPLCSNCHTMAHRHMSFDEIVAEYKRMGVTIALRKRWLERQNYVMLRFKKK